MEYNPQEIEPKWQQYWNENNIYQVENESDKPKYYVLDMFPYPSGAGLHVGHPLGYIASDIVSRYKRLKGHNVLHPMGFDSFGLPAEQYAINTRQHPAITTAQNIKTFKSQLAKIGFCYDWSREVQTSDPNYYKWTQWIFQQIFNSYFNNQSQKAEAIEDLIQEFEKNGNQSIDAACDEDTSTFSVEDWKNFSEEQKEEMLLKYRLTYVADSIVNWCPALGTVLANDEIKDGLSERGGHPVERKKMRQWMMRITAYSERLLQGLEKIEWSDALKEMQRNWIGKSYGAEMTFQVETNGKKNEAIPSLTVFTTRPDTIFGVTFMVIAPEHEMISHLITDEQKAEAEAYIEKAKNRSERERQAEVKTVTGIFTGSYAVNPFNGEKVPIWSADYVLAGYGTGVVMAVPEGDERDFRFARHFDLPVIPVKESTAVDENGVVLEADSSKNSKMINSGFLDGMSCADAIQATIKEAEAKGFGEGKVNYRLRDAVFSRQRYWGEPVPVYFKNGIPYLVPEEKLPLTLPQINEYKPTATGEPPLGRAKDWKYDGKYNYELTTMPGWAGSSWYFLRYQDAQNQNEFASKQATDYWNQVDLYIGGTEHAVGHLLYSRFWTKFLFDRGYISFEEPFKKLINQGMIQGTSALIYRVTNTDKTNLFVSHNLRKEYETTTLHVAVNLVKNDVLDLEGFKQWREEYQDAEFILEDGKYICGSMVEKMSKRWYNVVNPDDVVTQYGADTLRVFEMFLGPLEQSKPWDPKTITGPHNFLKKFWRLFVGDTDEVNLSGDALTKEELKLLHQTIKRVEEDIERYSFNTVVSTLMSTTNELTKRKCNKQAILEPLTILLAPYAPHIAEELWAKMGHVQSIHTTDFPKWEEKYLKEDSFEYPVMINGKKRTTLQFPADMPQDEMQQVVLENEVVQKWAEGKAPKKIIIVPKKIVNVVL